MNKALKPDNRERKFYHLNRAAVWRQLGCNETAWYHLSVARSIISRRVIP